MDKIPHVKTGDAAVFPDPDVLDDTLRAYLRRAGRMGWSPYDLADSPEALRLARVDLLDDAQLSAVITVLYVEDHLPGYVSEYLRLMADPGLPDAQYITNRQVLHYVFQWAAEEDRHGHVLETYLTRTGLMTREVLEADMARERKTPFHFPYSEMNDIFIYLAMQEKATCAYYRALEHAVDEPLLKAILGRMAMDEASHTKFFHDTLIRSHAGDLEALARRVSALVAEFRMPVQSNLTNYRRQVLGMMRAAPGYRHGDVMANLLRAVERAARGATPQSLELITPEGP
ncbi:MAG: acyl-ACP desaturase [Isosphaeraceae bacterium]